MIKDKSIFIKNIYYMLSYAFTELNQSSFDNVDEEAFDNIHNLFAAILAKGIAKQLKQGLYREYISKCDSLMVVRGKINMPGTIKNRISQRVDLSCEYDELSENNYLNQILKTTVLILLQHGDIKKKYKDTLKKEMLFFSNVDMIMPFNINWSLIRFERNNKSYRILISICELVLNGMLQTSEEGRHRLAQFVDDQTMSRLYEKFILEYYVKEYKNKLRAKASQIHWELDDNVGTYLPIMQSDVMLYKGNKILIIDAKYYTQSMQIRFDKPTIHSNNLYQIFTYVKNEQYKLQEKNYIVAGMLLYAKTDEEISPNCDYKMSGNAISVKTLDLNCDFSVIKKQLNFIADSFFKDIA